VRSESSSARSRSTWRTLPSLDQALSGRRAERAAARFFGAAAEIGLEGRVDVAHRAGRRGGVEDGDRKAAPAERGARHGGVAQQSGEGRRALAAPQVSEAHGALLP